MRCKGREGGKEREKEGKHYSSVPSKHEMLGYFNKKKSWGGGRSYGRERDTERQRERQTEKERERERERQSDKQRGGKAGK